MYFTFYCVRLLFSFISIFTEIGRKLENNMILRLSVKFAAMMNSQFIKDAIEIVGALSILIVEKNASNVHLLKPYIIYYRPSHSHDFYILFLSFRSE